MLAFLNGEFIPREQARVPVDDRGFLFGDGIYEVIRSCDGVMFEPWAHLRRLRDGQRGIRLQADASPGDEEWLGICERLLRDSGLQVGDATVYLQVTRGAAARTHGFPPAATRPTVYATAATFSPPSALREHGTSAITQPDLRWARCHLKTLNLLPNVLAKQAAVEAGAFEAILVRDGFLTEGASTNVFGVIGGEIRTYPASNYILPGVTRAVVLQLAAELGLRVSESPILAAESGRLDELFITGTTTDVMPIVRLDGQRVGTGRPGPITGALGEALSARLAGVEQVR